MELCLPPVEKNSRLVAVFRGIQKRRAADVAALFYCSEDRGGHSRAAGLAVGFRGVGGGGGWGGVGWSEVVGAGADEAIVVVLLDDVGGPAGDAADGEDGSEEIDVDAEGGVGGGGVEVDVGVELLLLLDVELDLAGHVEPLGAAGGLAELFGHAAEVSGSRIF